MELLYSAINHAQNAGLKVRFKDQPAGLVLQVEGMRMDAKDGLVLQFYYDGQAKVTA